MAGRVVNVTAGASSLATLSHDWGKTFIWEVIGIDEYATIVNSSSYGPSEHIRRDGVELLQCK